MSQPDIETKSIQIKYLQSFLYGFDIDSTMVRIGAVNLMAHGINAPQIYTKDTLSRELNVLNGFDIVLSNPPFTGNHPHECTHENLTLAALTTKSDLLFVENSYRLLKKGGTACIIVPQTILFETNKACVSLRQMLIERCQLKAVITLPNGVFRPYAGLATAILLFTKIWSSQESSSELATQKVWFYEVCHDGYSLDDKRIFQKNMSDLPDLIENFHSQTNQTHHQTNEVSQVKLKKHFTVPSQRIKADNYNLSLKHFQC